MQIIHGEPFVVPAGPNDTVRWLQEEASALFSKAHNFSTHVVQVNEAGALFPTDVLSNNKNKFYGVALLFRERIEIGPDRGTRVSVLRRIATAYRVSFGVHHTSEMASETLCFRTKARDAMPEYITLSRGFYHNVERLECTMSPWYSVLGGTLQHG